MRTKLALFIVALAMLAAVAGAGAIGGAAAALFVLERRESAPIAAPSVARATVAPAAGSLVTTDQDAAVLAAIRGTRPAVVTVWNLQYQRTSFWGNVELLPVGSGSGVIFDERGYIATNAHVIQGAEAVEIVFIDGRRASASLVKGHLGYDLAILQVEGDLPAVASLGDSSMLEPGMRVLAIGSPLGTEYQNTVTTGIVAGLGRRVKQPRFNWSTMEYQEMDVIAAPLIQTDAAINAGNSGGPLIDTSGAVVGLNTLIVRSDSSGRSTVEGLGFAIPSNIVRALADEWIDGKPRPSLGIEFETIDPVTAREQNLAYSGGAVITSVNAGSSAQKAGLAVGDRITAIDGITIDLDHALVDVLWRYSGGDTVRLTVDRAGSTLEIAVPLGEDAGDV